MSPLRVGLIGATGETGSSVVNGLLQDGSFDIIALTRPASISKPANQALQQRGVTIRPFDIYAPEDTLVESLKDVQVLISAIPAWELLAQIPLATAAKKAGVQRFVPGDWAFPMPPGIHILRDLKEQVHSHILRLYLPYTSIDVGWWYQLAIPKLQSGKTDYLLMFGHAEIAGDGNQPLCITHKEDVGKYVAKMIADPRTLNKKVLVYNELLSQNQAYDVFEKLSGEKAERNYLSEQDILDRIKNAPDDTTDVMALLQKAPAQYMYSFGIRGDNQPDYARYLGYLTSRDLYPDLEYTRYEDFAKDVLDGKGKPIYEDIRARLAEVAAKQK